MKSISIASIGAIALLTTVSAIDAIPGVPSIWDMGSAIAQNSQQKGQLQLQLSAEKQVIQKDKEGKQKITWQPLQGNVAVQSKDVLRYTVSGENKGDRPIKNLALNQPIPKGMVYQLKSASIPTGGKITYKIDGASSFVENPTVQVKLPNGKVETQAAPASAYTQIRLNIASVPGKATVKASYQVQVR
ncbi:MAG: hypothetical protein KME60_29990 [Cyanomargarita calcarea GSE-NOS-MK-12-04C]|uniref:DUF11 domain-containing protein n=1 Tax=Cyanomargarita calcarea GSE-NOS-MK-12-04C TaxID=2839659 RepID=A0A951QSB1_9CYAN|nr:hypothetical protein [Cyanomargarita calcarea GSE-NOS-MK-12-04C]